MAILTVGPTSTHSSIADALVAALAGDTLSIEAGYGSESATISTNNLTVDGTATSTGIVLQLGAGVALFALTGDAPIAILDGADGNGIVGNDGDNVITVSSGVDAVDGGGGVDRLVVDYSLATGSVTGNSTSNFTEAGGGGRSVVITDGTIENFTVLTGAAADTLTTGDGDDIIEAGNGANTVTAGEGNNTLTGGADADTFTVGDGDNLIDAGDGANTIIAGQGVNTIVAGDGVNTITALDGGNVITGGDGTNIITSGAGADVITAGRGPMTIVAGSGSDLITVKAPLGGTINAGADDDRLVLDLRDEDTSMFVVIDGGTLATGYSGYLEDAGQVYVEFVGVENFTYLGGSSNDSVISGDGIDILVGNGGNDSLTSGDGDDSFTGGAGNDALNGGAGTDTAFYSGARSDYTITSDIDGNPTQVVDNRDGTPDGTDTLIDIEMLNFALNSLPSGEVLITGFPREDQTLTASNTLVDPDGLGTVSYQWQSNGADIAGATGDTFTLGQVQVGTVITVVASYTDGSGRAESVPSSATNLVENLNDFPTGDVTITGIMTQGEILTANPAAVADEDGLGAFNYQWLANGAVIDGATSTTFTLTQAEVGASISVWVNYIDQQNTAESLFGFATGSVANVNDAPTGTATITGTPTEDQVLTASNTLADADGLGTVAYQWQSNGTNIAGATGGTLTLGQAQVGTLITVVASYTDGQGVNESRASDATTAVLNVNDPPVGGPIIAGTPTKGGTLTVTGELADEDVLGPVSLQWRADGVAIAGATGESLTLTQAQVGTVIDLVASYTDGQGTDEQVISPPTSAVLNVNDAPTGSVTIVGIPTEDQVLTASNTLADADGLGTVSYQWRSGGIDIVGATGATLTLAQAQVGTTITVVASYTDGQGTDESLASDATTAVANVNDAPTGPVTISGTPAAGQILTASNALADEDGLGTVSYQWRADGTDIAGATNATFALTAAQLGTAISVLASYTDQQGTDEAVSSLPVPVAAPPPLPFFQFTMTETDVAGQTQAVGYVGPVAGLTYAFTGSAANEAVSGTASNDFIHLGAGDDAISGGDGDDVLDGGTGSNFLTGGAGRDIFFLDGRNGETTWSTITDWQGGEELALWGWVNGVSQATWLENAGTEGYRGATLHADLDNNGVIDTSVTWAGLTQADLPTPSQHDGLLWFA
ncbi:beta strand repeat-containing protein [Falsiroseomonas sp. HC035]|uniref:beta strand repeat-containing protein n=1 Tax=Falsiroseomonas sp. HC035 TaxID=3390999 RepID=UPI003D31D26E